MTDLVQFSIILIFVGFLFWLANRYIPMDRRIRQILNILAVVAFIWWLGNLFGSFEPIFIGH
nr:Thivi_2564 family membrane protein [uncultured Desulfobacter sp.]